MRENEARWPYEGPCLVVVNRRSWVRSPVVPNFTSAKQICLFIARWRHQRMLMVKFSHVWDS